MQIIVVTNVPIQCSLKNLIKRLAKVINGYFVALEFTNIKGLRKNCYVSLGPSLDPISVVESINKNNNIGFQAFIPDVPPKLSDKIKPKKMPQKLRRKLGIAVDEIPHGVLKVTHRHIMTEMQHKYPGLRSLIIKTKYKLYRALSEIVTNRLQYVLETNQEAREKCFILSKFYRRSHPHFADFQFILKTLHDIEQSAGLPRSHVSEAALSAVKAPPVTLTSNVPINKIKTASRNYSRQIINKVTEHINNYDVTPNDNDTEEDVARKRVRMELQKISRFVPEIIRQVITNNFVVAKEDRIKMCIYGEPFLPNKEVIKPFLKKFHASNVSRSNYMYNMISFELTSTDYGRLMEVNGTMIECGATLHVRPLSLPVIKMKERITKPRIKKIDTELDTEDQFEDEFMEVDNEGYQY